MISYYVVHMIHFIKVKVIDRIFSSHLCLLLCCGIKQFMSVLCKYYINILKQNRLLIADV